MANYNDLKTGIDAVIKTNGRQKISGAALNTQLKNMIAELGAGYQYMGVATPANPGTAQTPDYKCFYLATTPGPYTNLGGLVVAEGEVCALVWNGTWTKEETGIDLVSLSQDSEKTTIRVGTDSPKEIPNYNNTPIIGESQADLSIKDENGNTILRLNDGHIRTKNFNSKDKEIIVEDSTIGDLSIADEDGHKLLLLKDGHIRTKYFDSKHIDLFPLSGRSFSILGDSISTFRGYLRSDEPGYDGSTYAYWYPQTYLNNVNDTWWKKLEKLTGMTLLQNCAWSGSQVCGNSQSTASAQAGCSTRRITDLSKNGIAPDIILILIGVNDLRNSDSRALGDWDGNDEIVAESVNVDTFSAAYSLMVSKIMTTYPNSEIFCCTILDTGHSGWDTHDNAKYPCMNDRGNTTKEWNDTIQMVSESLGAKVLDMHACGIDFFNLDTFTGDRLHPNAKGATLMAKQAARELMSKSKFSIK